MATASNNPFSFLNELVPATVVPEKGLNRKYLRLQDLRRLRHLFFSSRRAIEGQYSGRHSTPQRGQSVEFRDYRQYIPGDELETVDWKVYGRSDKLFVKIFEHQADMTVNLLVDASASMAYRGLAGNGPLSKYDQACFLAAAIGFLVTKQNDRVSFGMARGWLAEAHRPQSSMVHLANILRTMERVQPEGEAGLATAIRDLVGRSRRRDLLVVFSDLLDDREGVLKSLARSLHRGGEVILFHVLHADELELPDLDSAQFIDSETGQRVRLSVSDIRPAYEARMREFLEGWSSACKGHGIDYNLVSTADPYHKALERYLYRRGK
jgi:uncharacterized protein (DUF58 family)